MSFYTAYTDVLDAAKTILEQVTGIARVIEGERFEITKLPMAVVDPGVTPIRKGSVGRKLQLGLRFQVALIVQDNEPEDWRKELVKPLSAVIDAFLRSSSRQC